MTRQRITPIDETVRRRAAEFHTGLISVEAGAGTGKTTILTERYIELIRQKRARPTEIVAITFTEKAAQELRFRIRKALTEAHMTDALEEIDRVPVSTIHAFAASILRERPIEAAVDPNFELLDELSQELFLADAYRRWIPTALENDRPVFARALAAGITLPKVGELARMLYRHRDLLGALSARRVQVDPEKEFDRLSVTVRELSGHSNAHCKDLSDAGYQAVIDLAEAVSSLADSTVAVKERALLLRLSVPTNKGNQKAWSPPSALKELKERMKLLSERLEGVQSRLRANVFSELLSVVKNFVGFIEEEKRRAGKLEFDDLLLMSRDVLNRHPEVLEYFQKRFKYFVVDEFQDTDPLQAEIIWLLSSKPDASGPWNKRELVPGKLFLVGDPKQSIYRFRRADVETYRAAAGQVASQGERLVIRQNFRSSPPLIDWFNRTFSKILGASYEALSPDTTHAVAKDRRPILLLEAGEGTGRDSSRDVRSSEAEAIAALLREFLDHPSVEIADPETGILRPVRTGDIAILFPTTTGIDLFEEQLRRYELPFSLEGGRMFYSRAEVHAVLMTLEAIAHPADSVAVVAALRSSLFGLSDQNLVDLIVSKTPLDYRTDQLRKGIKPASTAFRILKSLHDRKEDLSPAELLAALYEEALAVPLALTRFHGEQAAANLEKLLDLIRALELRGLSSLEPILRWFQERSAGEERQDESPLFEEDGERIRLITVHRAKGLEFPVVVLANLASARDHTDQVIVDRLHHKLEIGIGQKGRKFMTEGFEELQESESVQRADERRRLLYVAATRARDLLILPRFIPDRGVATLWKILDEGVDPTDASVQRRSVDSLSFRDDAKSTVEPSTESKGRRSDEKTLSVSDQIAERTKRFKPGLQIQSATERAHSEDEPTREPGAGGFGSRGTRIGNATHAALEKVDFKNPGDVKALCRWAAQEVSDPEIAMDVEKLVAGFLASPLAERFRKAKRILREVPFSIQDGEKIFEGFIDVVVEESDGLVIVDYKTDRVQADTLDEKIEHYKPQINLYADALGPLTGLPIKEKILAFLRIEKAVGV